MRTRTLLFTALLRALVICIFLLLVLLDVSRSPWIDLAGLAVTGLLLLAVVLLAVVLLAVGDRRAHNGRHPSEGIVPPTLTPTPPPAPR